MNLRILTPSEAPAYRDVRLRALREWPPAFGTPAAEEEKLTLKDFANRLVESRDRLLIGAFAQDVLAGTVRLSRYEGSNELHRAYLAGLYVTPEARGRGLGRALVQHAIRLAKADPILRRLNLTVVSGQTPAISLYESLGFLSYGVEKEAFEARGIYFDEILMSLDLPESK